MKLFGIITIGDGYGIVLPGDGVCSGILVPGDGVCFGIIGTGNDCFGVMHPGWMGSGTIGSGSD